MESLDYWRLCDEISVIDAALLIVGEDPSASRDYVEGWPTENQPKGYSAARAALVNAILGKRLEATLRYPARRLQFEEYSKVGEQQTYDENTEQDIAFTDSPDWKQSTIKVEKLKLWLMSRGFKTGFFFADKLDAPDYLDQLHPCYAPKLAAAISAWEAITADEKLLEGKTPKQALEKWLRENASQFGLSDEDGDLSPGLGPLRG